ncbi:hypothetical protein D3C81_743380 [compost metagenome]
MASAARPLCATSTSTPKLRAMLDRISRALALSSTTNTRLPSNSSAVTMRRKWLSRCTPRLTSKWKVEPRPGSLSTQMRPPINSTRCREMARPNPVPPYLRVVVLSAWLKG